MMVFELRLLSVVDEIYWSLYSFVFVVVVWEDVCWVGVCVDSPFRLYVAMHGGIDGMLFADVVQ